LHANSFIQWKLEEHSELIKFSSGHSLFLDFFSKNYRKKSFERWLKIFVESALSQGFSFTKNTPPLSLKEIFTLGIYNIEGFTPSEGQQVLDVGASYGDSSIWWAKKFGAKVVAFEPLKDVFIELEKNVEINSVDVVAYNVAIGNGEEIAGNSQGGMFSAGGDLKIKTKRLDDYSFDRVDLLKIDVEGFEHEVLKGAENTINKFKPRIIIETHSSALRMICDKYLLNHGYSLRLEGRTVTAKAPGMDKITNLFYGT
jgi:FkbM family methyltransferase